MSKNHLALKKLTDGLKKSQEQLDRDLEDELKIDSENYKIVETIDEKVEQHKVITYSSRGGITLIIIIVALFLLIRYC